MIVRANVVVSFVTIFGVVGILGLSVYQGYSWRKRIGSGFLPLCGALICGLGIGVAALLGAEALVNYEYFMATWAVDGVTSRHIMFGFVVGSGATAVGWVARRSLEKRQGCAEHLQ